MEKMREQNNHGDEKMLVVRKGFQKTTSVKVIPMFFGTTCCQPMLSKRYNLLKFGLVGKIY